MCALNVDTPPLIAGVKNEWRNIYILPIRLHVVDMEIYFLRFTLNVAGMEI